MDQQFTAMHILKYEHIFADTLKECLNITDLK